MSVAPRNHSRDVTSNINPNAITNGLRNTALPPPKTPSRPDINQYFSDVLCPLVGHLPYEKLVSPQKRPRSPHHEAVVMVKELFWTSRPDLSLLIEELEQSLCEISDPHARFKKFYEQLTESHRAAVKFTRLTPSERHGNTANVDVSDMPPPARRVLFQTHSKSNLVASPNMNTSFDYSTVAARDSATTSFASTTSSNPASSNLTRSFNSFATGLTSVGTSFTSDAAAKTLPSTPVESTQKDDVDCSSELFGSSFEVTLAEGFALEQLAIAETKTSKASSPRPPVRAPSVEVSPTKAINYRVRNIPADGLAPHDLPKQLHRVPFHLRLEAYRVMRATDLQPEQFVEQLGPDPDFTKLYTSLPHWPRFERSERFDLSRSTLHASLQWSSHRRGPSFEFTLQVPQRDDLSAFQLKFGADRFLVVDLPRLDRPPSDYKGQEEAILVSVLEMLRNPQSFLGRTWVAYHHHVKKPQITFFAVSGVDIGNPVSISQLLDWYIPFGDNHRQPACKASARLDLGQSNTKETIMFEHHQICRVRDSFATKDPSDTRFNDPALIHRFKHHFDDNVVMNDGCNEISYAAMVTVQESLKLSRPPAVVQGRIFGAKGLWYRSANEASDEVYIRISISQTKIRRVLGSETDPAHLQLGVLNWSRPAKPSFLYPGFLPILQHRGVPAQTILEIAREQVEIDTSEFLACLHDRKALRQWVHQQKDLIDERVRAGSVWTVGGFPNLGPERICLLTESGFDPDKCKKLADETYKHGNFVFDLEAKRFKVRLSQSTSVLGIADPTGVLNPGEIYLAFSQQFKGSCQTGSNLTMLDGQDCLVARNPAMRGSDIQKVRAVYRTELSHLQDVVVFPSRGDRPLANKLSGGDYDGDTFWSAGI